MFKNILISTTLVVGICSYSQAKLTDRLSVKLITNQTLYSNSIVGDHKYTLSDVGLGLEYDHPISNKLDLCYEFNWIKRTGQRSDDIISYAHSLISGQTRQFIGSLKVYPIRDKSFEAYVTGGCGIGLDYLKVSAFPFEGFVWGRTRTYDLRTITNSSEPSFVWLTRVGFNVRVLKSVLFGFEFGYVKSERVQHPISNEGGQVVSVRGIDSERSGYGVNFTLKYHFSK